MYQSNLLRALLLLSLCLFASGQEDFVQADLGASIDFSRFAMQGGVYLDGERVTDEQFEIEVEKEQLLRVGKRKFYRLQGRIEK